MSALLAGIAHVISSGLNTISYILLAVGMLVIYCLTLFHSRIFLLCTLANKGILFRSLNALL